MPSQTPQNEKSSSITPLRTYRGDAEKVIKSRGESLSTMVFAEQKKRRETKTTPQKPEYSRKNIIFLLASAFFVIIGIIIFIFVFLVPASPSSQGGSSATKSQLIITEKEKKIVRTTFTEEGIAASVRAEINETPLFLNQIQSILFIKSEVANPDNKSGQLLDISGLLTLVTSNMPPEFPRSLTGEYLYGVHSLKDNHPFLIAKVGSFANTFASLLRWELFMARDFVTLFELSSINIPRNQSFKDIVVKNRDARVLQDAEGGTILIYGFADQETLIITTNKDTFGEIVKRLTQ